MTNMCLSRLKSMMATGAIVFLMVPCAFAQEQQAPAPAPAPPSQGPQPPPAGGGQQGGGGRQQAPQISIPDRTQPASPIPELPRPIYLSGSVRLSDGSIPPTNIVIERICGGVVRPEAYTDSKGNFNFMVGSQSSALIADASVGADPFSRNGQNVVTERSLIGCEIRASLAGFQSDSIMLGFRQALDDPDIGIIRLHRLPNVEGDTLSISTAPAPRRHPAILPIDEPSIVLSSETSFSLNLSAICPSKTPAIPSVIAFPTAPPMIAPATPAMAPPITAKIARMPLSIKPNIISGHTFFIVILNRSKEPIHSHPRANITQPISCML